MTFVRAPAHDSRDARVSARESTTRGHRPIVIRKCDSEAREIVFALFLHADCFVCALSRFITRLLPLL